MDDTENARFAANVAIEILKRHKDGMPLLAIHRNYPTGAKAIEVGFCLGVGVLVGCSSVILVATMILRAGRWLFT